MARAKKNSHLENCCRTRGDAAESKKAGNDRNNEENKRPFKHLGTPCRSTKCASNCSKAERRRFGQTAELRELILARTVFQREPQVATIIALDGSCRPSHEKYRYRIEVASCSGVDDSGCGIGSSRIHPSALYKSHPASPSGALWWYGPLRSRFLLCSRHDLHLSPRARRLTCRSEQDQPGQVPVSIAARGPPHHSFLIHEPWRHLLASSALPRSTTRHGRRFRPARRSVAPLPVLVATLGPPRSGPDPAATPPWRGRARGVKTSRSEPSKSGQCVQYSGARSFLFLRGRHETSDVDIAHRARCGRSGRLAATAQTNQPGQYKQAQNSIRHHPLEMSAAPSLDHKQILQLQQVLQDKGFEPGAPDGIFGPRTKEALRDFQDRFGIKVSGEFDNQTLYALGKPEYAGP